MAPPGNQPDRFDTLLHRMCDDRLTEAEAQELVAELRASEWARRRYMHFVCLSVSLNDWSVSAFEPSGRREGDDQPVLGRYPDLAAPEVPGAVTPASGAPSVTRSMWVPIWLCSAAAILMAVLLGVMTVGPAPDSTPLAEKAAPPPVAAPVDPHVYVARVVEVTPDADWDIDAMPREFLMRLRLGEKLHLLRGLAKIEFYSGAQLILHGPARFEATGPASGWLHDGRLSGRVDEGGFLLTTPSAEVIDLGTEFGVSVGPESETDVLVFDGKVKVRADGRGARRSINLTQGMGVRVGGDGLLTDANLLTIDRFSRRFSELSPPAIDGANLSLVDILCGGSGRGQRLAAAIDPLTGDWDRLGWQKAGSPGTRRGDVDYHASDWHPMIDGAFIPDAHGNPTQVDSTGREVFLPPEHGTYTWGPVWARRFSKDLKIPPIPEENDFWGADTFPVISRRLADSRYGGIGVHANVGITFDLQGVREQHGAEVESFHAVLTNLDNSEAHNPEYAKANVRSANFWVVVDGQVRFERLNFQRNVEGVKFGVPIAPGDRMLTLVSTDAGDSNKYDHIVLIDPVLNLRIEPRALGAPWLDSPPNGNGL